MDSRIREVKTKLIKELTTNGNGDRARRLVLELQDGRDGGGYCIAAIESIIDRSLALLTAEPEPCSRCRRKNTGDCDPCGPPAWESYDEREPCEDFDKDVLTIDRVIRYPEHFPGLAIEASAALERIVARFRVDDKRTEELRAQVESLREASKNIIAANVRPKVLNTYEHPTSVYHPSFGGGDCEKHGRWYGICHSCREEEKEAMEQAVYEANSKRGEALDAAFKELSIALAATEPKP